MIGTLAVTQQVLSKQPPQPACGPDLIRSGFFWICFLLFFIFFLILSVSRYENIRSPAEALLTQRLLGLQAGLLKSHLLPIA